ncbi:MAG: RNA chaperone Hfq [Holophagales bacterium]|nr:RNA chaperone Hfq [Holophagales bacterium]
MINKPPINVQDGFFYQLRKENTLVDVVLLSERKRLGRIKRFDKYALVLDVDGREEMIYKHAIASVSPTPVARPAAPAAPVPNPAPAP